jgi:hypothetical protein
LASGDDLFSADDRKSAQLLLSQIAPAASGAMSRG